MRARRFRVWVTGAILLAVGLEQALTPSLASADGVSSQSRPASISISEGNHTRYYHILLKLHPGDFALTVPADQRRPRSTGENRYEFSAYGQFEIFVRKDLFPVPAPHCERYIIVRMPGTDPSAVAAAGKIERKRTLFDALEKLKRSGIGTCDVAIELNPYVRVVSSDPLQVELTECNVFFRQADGAYIDHVGPLQK